MPSNLWNIIFISSFVLGFLAFSNAQILPSVENTYRIPWESATTTYGSSVIHVKIGVTDFVIVGSHGDGQVSPQAGRIWLTRYDFANRVVITETQKTISRGSTDQDGLTISFAAAQDNFFGWSLALLSVASDGTSADIAVGAPGFSNDENSVYFLRINPDSPGYFQKYITRIHYRDDVIAFTGQPYFSNARFGSSVVGFDDVDGDGQRDIVVGAPGLYNGKGAVFIIRLDPDYRITSVKEISERTGLVGLPNAGRFGAAITAYDWDGDSNTDLFISGAGQFASRGDVYFFSGPFTAAAVTAPTKLIGPMSGNWFGPSPNGCGTTCRTFGISLGISTIDSFGDRIPDLVVGFTGGINTISDLDGGYEAEYPTGEVFLVNLDPSLNVNGIIPTAAAAIEDIQTNYPGIISFVNLVRDPLEYGVSVGVSPIQSEFPGRAYFFVGALGYSNKDGDMYLAVLEPAPSSSPTRSISQSRSPSETPSPSVTPSSSPSPSSSQTPTSSASPTSSQTPTSSPSDSPSASRTQTPTTSPTTSPSSSSSPSSTPSATTSPSSTPSESPSPSITPTSSVSISSTPSSTSTPSTSLSSTSSPSNTPSNSPTPSISSTPSVSLSPSPPICPNGVCDGPEDCNTCPDDCPGRIYPYDHKLDFCCTGIPGDCPRLTEECGCLDEMCDPSWTWDRRCNRNV